MNFGHARRAQNDRVVTTENNHGSCPEESSPAKAPSPSDLGGLTISNYVKVVAHLALANVVSKILQVSLSHIDTALHTTRVVSSQSQVKGCWEFFIEI